MSLPFHLDSRGSVAMTAEFCRQRVLEAGLRAELAVICLAIAWLAGGAAVGAEPKVPTPRPEKVLMAPSKLLPAYRRCLIRGAPLYQDQDLDSPVLGSLDYLERVELAEGFPESAATKYRFPVEARSQHKDWALVCVADPTRPDRIQSLRGWVPRRYLAERLEAERVPETLVQKKCVIVFRGGSDGLIESVQPLLTPPDVPTQLKGLPDLNASPPLELYRLLFVYAEYGNWVLVSPDPAQVTVDVSDNLLRENVFGWVPRERLAMWTTRECFQWDRESYPDREADVGRMFLKPEDAIAHAQGRSIDSVKEPDPRSKGKVIGLTRDAMRFHLLLDPKGAQKKGLPNATAWYDTKTKTNSLYEVGAVLSDGRINSRVEGEQSQIEGLASETADTEVLFVIDDTGSMRIAFKVVARIVEEIAKSLVKAQTTGDVRVGICYYHDGDTVEDAVDTKTTPLESIKEDYKLQLRLTQLRDKKVVTTSNKDRLERVYDGLSQGIAHAGFKANTRKLVFLLGDCGEKGTSEATLDDLAAQLIPEEASPLEFHVVQLKDPDRIEEYGLFRTQLRDDLQKAYVARLGERFGELFEAENEIPETSKMFSYQFIDTPATGEPNIEAVVAGVSKTVLPSVSAAQKEGDLLRKTLRQFITTGKLEVKKQEADIAEAAIAPKVLLQQILKDAGLENYGKSPQFYRTMYVWELNRASQRQLKRMVFVKDVDIADAIAALTALELNLREGRDLKTEDAVIKVLARQVGSSADIPPEITDDRGKAQWLLQRLSFQSDVFLKLMDPEKHGSPTIADYSKVFLKRRLLEAILAGRRVVAADYQEIKSPGSLLTEWQLRKELTTYEALERGFPRFYKSGATAGRDLWYYVAYNEEWP